MRIRYSRLLPISIAAAAIISGPAQASVDAYDGFAQSFPAYANGGSGFGGTWVQGGFHVSASGYIASDRSLCYRGLKSSGGRISGAASAQINGAIRTLALPLGADNTTVFMSFLIQPQGSLNAGIFDGFFGVTLNGSLGEDLFIGKPGSNALNRFVLETRGGLGQVPSDASTVLGKTRLLVLKAQFKAGNDLFTLYVDPIPGAGEPASTVVKSDLDLGVVSAIGIYSSGAFSLDEVRIGSSIEDVTPAADTDCTAGESALRGDQQ